MRAIPAYLTPTTAVIAAATATVLLLTACSGGGSTPPTPTDSDIAATSSAPQSTTASTTVPTVSSTATTSSSPITGPASTTPTTGMTPTLPTDVPTIGPNMRAGEKPPIEPVAALAHTPAGAKAFAVFFIKTIDWGYATTSSTYMRHYYDNSCIQCRNAATLLDSARSDHGHYVGSRIAIDSARVIHFQANRTDLRLRLYITAVEYVGPAGKGSSPAPAYPNFRQHVVLRWAKGQWVVISANGSP